MKSTVYRSQKQLCKSEFQNWSTLELHWIALWGFFFIIKEGRRGGEKELGGNKQKKRSCSALGSGARQFREEEALLAVVVIKGELCLPLVVQRGLTERCPPYSRLLLCSGTPAGCTHRGSARTLPQPLRCGTAGASGTEEHENRRKKKNSHVKTEYSSYIVYTGEDYQLLIKDNHEIYEPIAVRCVNKYQMKKHLFVEDLLSWFVEGIK